MNPKLLFSSVRLLVTAIVAVCSVNALAAEVALFSNTSYVEYNPGSRFSEASNLEASLEDLGHTVTNFTGIESSDFANAVNNRDAIAIPELAFGDLASDMGATARSTLSNYVADGGLLIINATSTTRATDFLNTIFSFSLVRGAFVGTSTASVLNTADASTTPFIGGASALTGNSTTYTLTEASLPTGSRIIYPVSTDSMITMIPFGKGIIAVLGWDWNDAEPTGFQDGGWNEILNRSLQIETLSQPQEAALLVNPDFTDFRPGNSGAEGSNLVESLDQLGHTVTYFTDITPAGLDAALDSRHVLLIPDLELGDLNAALTAGSRTAIADFVTSGGLLFQFADFGSNDINLLNAIFGWSLANGDTGNSNSLNFYTKNFSNTAGTIFADGPAGLPDNNGDYPVTTVSLPPAARALYQAGADTASALVPVGKGYVVFIGWDWFNAPPVGTLDEGGWFDVVDRAFDLFKGRSDFDRDKDADVLVRNPAGTYVLYNIEDFEVADSSTTNILNLTPNSTHRTNGHFDHDGDVDVLVRGPTGGWRIIEFQDGSTNGVGVPGLWNNLTWAFQTAADFDGDGDYDVLLRNSSTGAWRVFVMEDRSVQTVVTPGLWNNQTWEFRTTGDVDADGDADILVRNASTGAWRVFRMANSVVSGSPFNPGLWRSTTWTFQGIGDMDKDGDEDIVLRSSSNGSWRVFNMNNGSVVSATNPGFWRNLSWVIENLGDYDADRDMDLLVTNTGNGNRRIFEVNNRAFVRAHNPGLPQSTGNPLQD